MNKERVQGLEALRALACLGIVSSHCQLLKLGHWGVSVFFVLSGFVQALSYTGELVCDNRTEFVWKKIKRLYPLHLIMILLDVILLESEYITRHSIMDIFTLGTNALLIQSWVPYGGV